MPSLKMTHNIQASLILAFGGLLWWLSEFHPSVIPVWAPWDFSWGDYLAFSFSLLWFFRGLLMSPEEKRLALWRRVFFLVGIAVLYAVMQTHYEYMAQHMFFFNRIQHVAMHHLGPFLIALGFSGSTIKQGMPEILVQIIDNSLLKSVLDVVQQPVIAAILFVGLFCFWLIPPVHFNAMLSPSLYRIMNWSMVIDGLLFWSLVLDPRPYPQTRTSYGVRMLLVILVIFPQILLGASITLASHDLYPYYALCGRIIPSIDALQDQTIGGIIIWFFPAMMSLLGFLLILNFLRLSEERKTEGNNENN